MNSCNLFKAIDPGDLEMTPFPHFELKDLLEPAFAASLAAGFPGLSTFTKGESYEPSFKLFRRHDSLVSDETLSSEWKQFLAQHDDLSLHHEITRLFGETLDRTHPDFVERFGSINEMRMGHRHAPDQDEFDLYFDMEAVIHTPSLKEPVMERGPHVKGRKKIAELHYFLRDENDTEGDCEFVLFETKEGGEPAFGARNQTSEDGLGRAKGIPYRLNSGILILNSSKTITQITPRKSDYPFQGFIIVFQLKENIFSAPGLMQ